MTAYVIITHDTGRVQRMLFATHRTENQIDDHSAKRCGFQKRDGSWHREPTNEAVAAEIARTKYPDDFGAIVSFAIVSEQEWHATPRHVEPPRVRNVNKPKAEVDLTPILAALTALNERLELTDKKADEAKQQSSTSLKIIDAIAKSAENVAEGRV